LVLRAQVLARDNFLDRLIEKDLRVQFHADVDKNRNT
jgi:hypothetical protein